MAKLKMPADAAKAFTVPERLLLLCVAAGINFTEVVAKGLIERDAGGHLALSDRGRAVLRAMLPVPPSRRGQTGQGWLRKTGSCR